jgi:hypothetical protein
VSDWRNHPKATFGGVFGVWDVVKVPVAWHYTLFLKCCICDGEATFEGESVEGSAPDIGSWRRLDYPKSGHDDPLNQLREVIVCSRDCFAALWDVNWRTR